MQPIEKYWEILTTFFDNYDLEILWFTIVIYTTRVLIFRLQNPLNTGPTVTNSGEKFVIEAHRQLNSAVDRGIMIVTVPVLVSFFVFYLYESNYHKALNSLGMLFTGIALFHNSRHLVIHINENDLILGGEKFKKDQIQSLAIWDDMIVFDCKNGNKEEALISFGNDGFNIILEMIKALKLFCRRHDISLEDHFEYEKDKNEMVEIANKKRKWFNF